MKDLTIEGRGKSVIQLGWALISIGTLLIVIYQLFNGQFGYDLLSIRAMVPMLILFGFLLLLYSVLRQRLREVRQDPYRLIEK